MKEIGKEIGKEIFKDIPKIKYEGPKTKNNLAFRYYNPEEKVGKKTMKEHLRFSVAYWHTMTLSGMDPFGAATMQRPWDNETDAMKIAEMRAYGMMEFASKLDIPFYCFHDLDIAPEADTLAETNDRLDTISTLLGKLMKEHKIELLWGTSNLFSHARFMNGAFTNPDADVFAYSAAKIKKALDITKKLNGKNYVFWGGREGYETLLNTDMGLEQDNFARFLKMVLKYAKKIGFKGQFLIEPKPKEPTKHQYDFDAATVIGFLTKYGLQNDFKLNLEVNHATLAGHSMQHDMQIARINKMLGSLDANFGDLSLGWDTDQFATDIYLSTLMMYEVLKNGGIGKGGLNFDAKVRRPSVDTIDLCYGHISSMDTFAFGLKAANSLLESGDIEDFIKKRYSSYKKGIGKNIVDGKETLESLEKYALAHDCITPTSGRQEMLEIILNKHIFNTR